MHMKNRMTALFLQVLLDYLKFCFEQAWKMMKEVLAEHGYSESVTGSPKLILKTAYAAGMIQDEELWLDALKDRNNVAHAYNESIAYDIVTDAKERFYDMFCALRKEIEQRWIE